MRSRTSSGRLIVPLAQHRITGTEDTRASWDPRPWTMWYLSDDEGAHWREAKTWWSMPVVSKSGLQEPGVVQLADGLLFSGRADRPGGAIRLPLLGQRRNLSSAGRPNSNPRFAGQHPAPAAFERPPGHLQRSFRALSVSAQASDAADCRHFARWRPHLKPQRRVLEDDPNGWYCYTAIHFVGDQVLLAYCAGDYPNGLDRLRIRRVPLGWFTTAP